MEKENAAANDLQVEVWVYPEGVKHKSASKLTNTKTLKAMLPEFDSDETKRITRKVDFRLIPVLTILYIVSFIDRSNIGNAKVAGMNAELELSGPQYNLALTAFFITYIIFEIPSNIVLKLTRPSLWIAVLVIAWGIV